MSYWIRLSLLGAVAALALALAGSALAALNPKLIVVAPNAVGAGPAVSITAAVEKTDAPVAKVTIYAPLGYQLNAPAPGAKIGDVDATAAAADLGNAVLPLKGDIVAADPSDPALAGPSRSCDDVPHAAVWTMNLSAAGQTLTIPMFVDKAEGEEAKLTVFKIVVCLPPPDVPAGTPGRATFGASLLSARFDLDVFANPPATGEYRWRSLWTPYTPGTGKADAAATVEAQSLVRLPTQVTIKAKKVRVKKQGKVRTLVSITGRLSEHGKAIPVVKVSVQDGKTKNKLYRLKAVATNKNGVYVKKLYVTRTSWFMAEVTTPLRTLGAAACTPTFGVPCVSAFVGGSHVLSNLIRVTPYRT